MPPPEQKAAAGAAAHRVSDQRNRRQVHITFDGDNILRFDSSAALFFDLDTTVTQEQLAKSRRRSSSCPLPPEEITDQTLERVVSAKTFAQLTGHHPAASDLDDNNSEIDQTPKDPAAQDEDDSELAAAAESPITSFRRHLTTTSATVFQPHISISRLREIIYDRAPRCSSV